MGVEVMPMLSLVARALVVGALLAFASAAQAEIKVSVQKTYYKINGKTGVALLEAMDRAGPKHGFLTRAIAQTRYSVTWQIEWTQAGDTCKVRAADADLDIKYMYPQVAGGVTAGLEKRWSRFFAGVRKHEEVHGRIAREMVAAAEKLVLGFATKNDRTCSKSKREVKRRVEEIYARYEAKQIAFDKKEHRDGGNVQGLVAGLIGRKK
jgi:predicted secreted Zn-dependent protease